MKGSDAHADESEAHSVGVLLLATVPVAVARRAVMDARTWKLKLRRGVRLHNGEDFTADAVKFTLDRLADSGDPVIQEPHTVLGVSDRGAPLVLEP